MDTALGECPPGEASIFVPAKGEAGDRIRYTESKFEQPMRFEVRSKNDELVSTIGDSIHVLDNDLCIFAGPHVVAEVVGFKWWKAESFD